jgi:hypothetical protein
LRLAFCWFLSLRQSSWCSATLGAREGLRLRLYLATTHVYPLILFFSLSFQSLNDFPVLVLEFHSKKYSPPSLAIVQLILASLDESIGWLASLCTGLDSSYILYQNLMLNNLSFPQSGSIPIPMVILKKTISGPLFSLSLPFQAYHTKCRLLPGSQDPPPFMA